MDSQQINFIHLPNPQYIFPQSNSQIEIDRAYNLAVSYVKNKLIEVVTKSGLNEQVRDEFDRFLATLIDRRRDHYRAIGVPLSHAPTPSRSLVDIIDVLPEKLRKLV